MFFESDAIVLHSDFDIIKRLLWDLAEQRMRKPDKALF